MTGANGKTTALIVLSMHAGVPLVVFAAVPPQADVSLYLAFIVQHPGVLVSSALAEAIVPYALNDPPGGCTAYSAVNAGMIATSVILFNAALHVFVKGVMTGAAGKTTTLTELLDPHDPVPAVPAAVKPQAAVVT